MAGYAANIEIQELLIDTKKDDIQTILDETASLRYKKKQIEKEIGSLTAQKVSLEETISEVTLLLMQQQDIVSQKQDRIDELDAEIAVETDPVRKAELEHERDLTIIERDTAQNYVNLYQNQLDTLNEQLNGIEDNIEANEALLVPIEEALVEPDAEIAAINEEIEDIQEVIAGIQQDINNYTNDYEEAKRQELENQYEYVEYIGATIVKVQATD
jgi:chromosome segregation ATPase